MYAYKPRRDEDFVDQRIAARLRSVNATNAATMPAVESPARVLQDRVERAFDPAAMPAHGPGLPIRGRFAVIIALASAAWLPVGALLFTLLQ